MRRSTTTLAKTTEFPSNLHNFTRRRLVDLPLASRIHIRNTFIYHIFNVSPSTRNSCWTGAAWLGSGDTHRGNRPNHLHCGGRDTSGHGLHKVSGNLLVESLLFRTLLRSHALLRSLRVELREGDVVHAVLRLTLDGTTELLDSLLLSVDTILLGNLHHLILLVETALTRTELEITRLVYGYEYWSHCLVYTEKMFKGEFRLLYI